MSADKRKVSTDALETLGTLIGPNEKRDAIHLAVLPVTAGECLGIGQSINVKGGIAYAAKDGLGIVDPFLPGEVQKGGNFWMVLRPRLITSLRHVWTHPELPDEAGVEAKQSPDKAASEEWLREFCDGADCPGYDAVMAAVEGDFGEYGGYIDSEYLHFTDRDAHGEIPAEFWTHLEIATGKRFACRPTYFSCSC